MKYFQISVTLLFTFIFISISFNSLWAQEYTSSQFASINGSYLGQTPPGAIAELFAPEIISSSQGQEMCGTFTEDGKEFYFNAIYKNSFSIYFTKEVDGIWTDPQPMSFSSEFIDRDFTISPDGNKIFFGSNRPRTMNSEKLRSLDIYFIERADQNKPWSEPQNIGAPINTDGGENYPSVANNGNLYFFACDTARGFGGCDIYRSNFKDGQYLKPVNLGDSINTTMHDWDAFIAPDENYIIFSSLNREDTYGRMDLYISFKMKNGTWSLSKNMGLEVNSTFDEICPTVTMDGKYLFFTSRRRGQAHIYWVDARIIQDIKQKVLKD